MGHKECYRRVAEVLFSLLVVFPVWAGDIADDIRIGTEASRTVNQPGGFLEVGVEVIFSVLPEERINAEENGSYDLATGLSLSAGYRYKRLFIELSNNSFDGLILGATFYESELWNLDVLLANIEGSINFESDSDSESDPVPETEQGRNEKILMRDSLYIASGLRITRYFGDSIIQFRLIDDQFRNHGVLGSVRYGHQWQKGNWNVQTIAGAAYYSSDMNNYLYGISESEASERFQAYKAGEAWVAEMEVGVTKPVHKNWVFSSKLRWRQLPHSISNSPLIAQNKEVRFSTGFNYVF